jgi:hypothetical protein
MNVDQVYAIVKLALSKNIQQGYVSPEDFNNAINTAQQQYLDYLLGEYQKYQPTRPIPVVGFAQTQKLRTSLAPLIYNTLLNINNVTGIAPFPSDFEQVDAMLSVYNIYNIRFTQQDRLSAWVRSTIDPVEQNPVYIIQHEGFQFYPPTLGQAKLSYVRKAPSIIWGYILDGNGIPTYNPATSQDPIWPDTDVFQVITRALRLLGVSLQVGDVSQYATEIKTIGQ